MENVYKIKIRSSLDPRELYPSERRYSSSIVLGFSIMFLALTMTSSLMGTLVVRKTTNRHREITNDTSVLYNETEADERFLTKVENDMTFQEEHDLNRLNISTCISSGTFVMSIGFLLAGCTGVLAWKRWYIDHNITWFFLACSFSTITSTISLLLVTLSLLDLTTMSGGHPPFGWGLTLNIIITSLLGVVWSICATRISFNGMTSDYPDDMVLSNGRGRIQVSTIKKGSALASVIPPDILNHFPSSCKLAKYFPKKPQGNLPKEESNKEFEERVKKFLAQPIEGLGGGGK